MQATVVNKGRARLMMRMIAVSVLVTIGFGAIAWTVLDTMWQRDRELVQMSASNVVASIGSEIQRSIEIYDLSLQAAADNARAGTGAGLSANLRQMILFDRAATAPGLGAIRVIDKNGHVIAESRPSVRVTDYSDRDFFQVHKFHKHSGRYITAPYLTGRGERVIGVTRRIEDANGEFAGVVVGTMKLSYLQDLLDRIQRKPGDALSLVRTNGLMIARAPANARAVPMNVSGSRIFRQQTMLEKGSFESISQIDNQRRIYAFSHLGDLPMILSYGTSLETMYAEWRQQAWYIGGIIFALCAINLALVIFLARSLRRSDAAERSLEKIATTDALTGLANRRRFDQVIEHEWNRARRSDSPVSLLMIDADHFKAFNDKFGHQAGDTALAAIADCIAHGARRAGDCSARYGGEEFAVILPGHDAAAAQSVANRILKHINDLREQQRGRDDITPTVSIGIATIIPQVGLATRDLIKAADAALYQAKQAGRGRYVASPSQLALVAKRMAA
jgi:diguanylate cyclase (GGDEF)-like protein